MTEICDYLKRLSQNKHLTHNHALRAFTLSLLGANTPSQNAALYMAMAIQGMNEEEYAGALEAFHARSSFIEVPRKSLHIGHSGESLEGFWIMLSAACILAALDIPVSGHIPFYTGNEMYNAEDILMHLGIYAPMNIEEAQACFDEVSIGFVPLSVINPRLREILPIHRELKIHSPLYPIFPFSYPSNALYHFIGLCSDVWVEMMGQYLFNRKQGHHGRIVAGTGGIEAYNLQYATDVSDINDDRVCYESALRYHDVDIIPWKGEQSALECAKKIRECLSGKQEKKEEPYFEYVYFHTSHLMVLLGMHENMRNACLAVQDVIRSGKALKKLNKWVEISTHLHTNYKRKIG